MVQAVSLQISHILFQKCHRDTGMTYQAESTFCSELEMTKIGEVFPDKIRTDRSVENLAKSSEVSSKSKSTPMCTPRCTPTSTPNFKSRPNGTRMSTLLNATSNTVILMSSEVHSISDCTPLDTPRSTPEPKIRDKYQDQSTKFGGTPNSMSVGTPICTLKDTPMCTPISTPKSKSYCTPMGPPDAKKRVAHKAESAYQSVWMIVNFEEVYLSKIRVRRSVQVLIFPSEDVSKYTLIQDSEVKRKFFQVVNE